MTDTVDYPVAADCLFLKSTAYIGIETPLPDFIELSRNGTLLQFRYNFKEYALGISKDGWLCGYRGKLKKDKAAEIVILRAPDGSYKTYDSRHTAAQTLERDLEALASVQQPPSGVPEPDNYYANLLGSQFRGAPF